MRILTLVNRTAKDIDFMYDSRPYLVKAGKVLNVPENIAHHAWSKSIAKLDPLTGQALYLLGVKDEEGTTLTDCEPLDYARQVNEELLDREAMGEKVETIIFSNPAMQTARVQPAQQSSGFDELRAPDAPPKEGEE